MISVRQIRLLLPLLPLLLAAGSYGQSSPERNVYVRFPQDSWAVVLNLPGFRIQTNGVRPDGRRYLMATNEATGMNVSLMLERGDGPPTLDGCHRYLERIGAQQGLQEVQLSTTETRVQLEYLIGEIDGVQLNQKFLRICTTKADLYVDLNLSKVRFQPEHATLFAAIVDSMRFEENPVRGSFEYWYEGSAEYRKRDFKRAIKPYRQALELEKQDRQLDTTFWRVLVDNLGMAYGVTGDLSNAKAVFEYGLGLDATYPLFHYNLACTFAEMNDRAGTLRSLRQAFALKKNVIGGERMPDPRTDDSFRRFMGDKEFRAEMDALASYLDTVLLTPKGKPWSLAIHLPGFTLQDDAETKFGGRVLQAFHEKEEIFATVYLNPLSSRPGFDCKESLKEQMERGKPSNSEVKWNEKDGIDRLEYTELTQFPGGGLPLRRKNMFACTTHDSFYAEVHIWKSRQGKKDEAKMTQILDSLRFVFEPVS